MPTVGYKETQYAYANTENGRVSLFNRFIDSFLFFNNLLLCVLFATSTSDHLLIIRSGFLQEETKDEECNLLKQIISLNINLQSHACRQNGFCSRLHCQNWFGKYISIRFG